MANVNFAFDAKQVIARLERIRANVPKALKAVGVYVLTAAQQTIISGGNGWPGWKRLPKRPHQMLWDTGTLLRSLTVGDSNNILELSDNSIVVGSNVAYAAAQNFGYPAHDLPARPFLVFDTERNEAAARVFLKYLMSDGE